MYIVLLQFLSFFVPWKPEFKFGFDSEINIANIFSTFPFPNQNKCFAPGYFWNVQYISSKKKKNI